MSNRSAKASLINERHMARKALAKDGATESTCFNPKPTEKLINYGERLRERMKGGLPVFFAESLPKKKWAGEEGGGGGGGVVSVGGRGVEVRIRGDGCCFFLVVGSLHAVNARPKAAGEHNMNFLRRRTKDVDRSCTLECKERIRQKMRKHKERKISRSSGTSVDSKNQGIKSKGRPGYGKSLLRVHMAD